MKFRDLEIGQTFDFINPQSLTNSFHRPCMKISKRKYRTVGGGTIQTYQVGTVDCEVFHVDEHGD